MDIADTEALLAGIETALTSILSNFDPATPLDMHDGVLLTLENVLQRVIVLQPLLCVEVSGFNQIVENIKVIVQELTAMEDEMQRDIRRSVGRPAIRITELELRNLLELHFSQAEIAKLFGCCA